MNDQDRFEYEVMQELWWLEQDADLAWINAQKEISEKREQEERNNGTNGER